MTSSKRCSGQDALLKRMEDSGSELLILDNFTTLSDTLEDENDATVFKKVQDFFLQLKRLGIATILVHHSNKGGKAMRGSSAMETTFEVIIGLRKDRISRPGEAKFVATFDKYRRKGDDMIVAQAWTFEDGDWAVGEPLPEDMSSDPVILALRSTRFANLSAIAKALGVHASTVTRRIQAAEANEVLKRGEVDRLLKASKEGEAATLLDDSDFVSAIHCAVAFS